MTLDLTELAARTLAEVEKLLAATKARLDELRAQIAGYPEKGIATPHAESLLSAMGQTYELQARLVETLRRESRKDNEHQELQRLLVDELCYREARLQEALAAGEVLAFDCDFSNSLIRRSNNAAQILGYDPQQAFDSQAFQARVHPDDLPRLKALWKSLDRDNPTCSIIFRFLRPDGREIWLHEISKAEFDAAGRFVRLKGLARDVTERIRAEQHQKILMAELDHRVKNVLARVVAVADATRQGGVSVDEFIRSFNGRIQSMAAAHALLSQSGWQGTDLAALVRSQLAPYATDVNITIAGNDIVLGASATEPMARVIHELVTNAAKYGALSIPGGHVSVTWDVKPTGQAASLILEWREAGGPPVASEVQSSYGTDLIRNLIPYELEGAVDLVFAVDGVRCRIEVPVEPS